MHAHPLRALGLAAAAALLLASAAPGAALGQVPNEVTDRLVRPLRDAQDIWDVYAAFTGFLSEVYPTEGKGRQAVQALEGFLSKFHGAATAGRRDGSPRVLEMPMGVDELLRALCAGAPGVNGNPMPPALEGNPKAQAYAAFLLPLLQLRGIAYRARPVLAQGFVLHQNGVNKLRRVKQDLRFRAGANGQGLFEFLTYPLAERKDQVVQFERIRDVQAWVRTHMIPTLDVAIELAEKALAGMEGGRRESLDLGLFLQAPFPFPDESMEPGHRFFQAPEVRAFLAQLYYNRARFRLFVAYDLDELPALTNKLRNVYLKAFFKEKIPFSSLKKRPRIGSPPIVRFRIAEKFQGFLTLKDGAQGPLALADLRAAWGHIDGAMRAMLQSSPGEPARLVNLEWVQATGTDYLKKAAPQIAAVLAGPASVQDFIGGASVDLDLPGFLSNLPGDLKAFFPTDYTEEKAYNTFEFSTGKVTYTNYDFGTPVGWNQAGAGSSWALLFPNISQEPNPAGTWDAPLVTVRDLSRTYVGRILAPILSQVVY